MSIGERLRLLRRKFDLSQAGMSSKFGIPSGSWKKYEAGPSEPGAGALRGLAEGGVNINWLLTGEGEMLLADQSINTEKAIFTPIDTVEFQRIFERLHKKDFPGYGMNEKYISYFTALVYNRVVSQSGELRNEALEKAVKELGLIILDLYFDNLRPALLFVQQHAPQLQDDMEEILKEYDNGVSKDAAALGSLRGKFQGRMLSPGSQLESEFLKGLVLSDDNT